MISPHWPRTSGRRSALDEVTSLGAQCLLTRGHRFELRADAAVRFAPRLVELVELALGASERFAYRCHETVDGYLARGQVALGTLGLHAQRFAREPQERFGMTLQLPVRELIESRAEPLGGQASSCARARRPRPRVRAARASLTASSRVSAMVRQSPSNKPIATPPMAVSATNSHVVAVISSAVPCARRRRNS